MFTVNLTASQELRILGVSHLREELPLTINCGQKRHYSCRRLMDNCNHLPQHEQFQLIGCRQLKYVCPSRNVCLLMFWQTTVIWTESRLHDGLTIIVWWKAMKHSMIDTMMIEKTNYLIWLSYYSLPVRVNYLSLISYEYYQSFAIAADEVVPMNYFKG